MSILDKDRKFVLSNEEIYILFFKKEKGGEKNMKCSLGMLCEPLKALGLHAHKGAAKKAAPRKVAKKAPAKKAVKKVAKKKSSRKRR